LGLLISVAQTTKEVVDGIIPGVILCRLEGEGDQEE
jgi:hypothetical protein